MFAIVGLGNPGRKYAATRHNVGFIAVDLLARELDRRNADWQEKFDCGILRGELEGEEVLFVKPLQFMNRSGVAATLLQYLRIPASKLIVVHDDLDLDAGIIRLKKGGSGGGHRGVADLIEKLGTDSFFRVRIGIGRPLGVSKRATEESSDAVVGWVLGIPPAQEREILTESVVNAVRATRLLIFKGLEVAQREFNKKPPKSVEETDG